MTAQLPLFDKPDEHEPQAERDVEAELDAQAAAIAQSMLGRDPYVSYDKVKADRNARKTGTLSAHEIPDHLKETMELAEARWQTTATGSGSSPAADASEPRFRLAESDLDQEWRESQQLADKRAGRIGSVPTNQLTSKVKNSNAARHAEEAHRLRSETTPDRH